MIRDMNGNIIPVGKTERKIEETFLYNTILPEWMTLTGGTYEIVPPNVDYGYLKITTPVTAASSAILNILPNGVDMTKVKEISLELDDLVFTEAPNYKLFISFATSDNQKGASFVYYKDGTEYVVARGIKAGVVTPINVNYNLVRNDAWKRRANIKVQLRSDGTLILSEGDSVFFEKKFSSSEIALDGILKPTISIVTTENVSHSVCVSRIALSVIHN